MGQSQSRLHEPDLFSGSPEFKNPFADTEHPEGSPRPYPTSASGWIKKPVPDSLVGVVSLKLPPNLFPILINTFYQKINANVQQVLSAAVLSLPSTLLASSTPSNTASIYIVAHHIGKRDCKAFAISNKSASSSACFCRFHRWCGQQVSTQISSSYQRHATPSTTPRRDRIPPGQC